MFDIRRPSVNERRAFFISIFLLSTISIIYVLKDYIGLILVSFIFSIVVRPLYRLFHIRYGISSVISSALTLFLALVFILLPLYLVIHLLIVEISKLASYLVVDHYTLDYSVRQKLVQFNSLLQMLPIIDIQITPQDIETFIRSIGKTASEQFLKELISAGGKSLRYLTDTFVFLLLTFFIIPSLGKIKEYICTISPLHDNIDEMYINRCITLILSLIKSVFIVALAQGILGGAFMWLAGVPYTLTVTLILVFASLIPYIGTNLVALPIALYMLLQGHVASAVIITLGQMVFVSNIDNLLSAVILSKGTSINPALLLLSIVGGVSTFGVSGLLFGPILCIFFLTSLEVYIKHYRY